MRGKRDRDGGRTAGQRVTPANAGKTLHLAKSSRAWGSPPLTRGKHLITSPFTLHYRVLRTTSLAVLHHLITGRKPTPTRHPRIATPPPVRDKITPQDHRTKRGDMDNTINQAQHSDNYDNHMPNGAPGRDITLPDGTTLLFTPCHGGTGLVSTQDGQREVGGKNHERGGSRQVPACPFSAR